MNNQKERNRKLLSILLALCMVLTIVPITALAAELEDLDFLPQGVTRSNEYKNPYHTQVNVTANVIVKGSDGMVVETTQVSKSSGDFVKGNLSDEAVQTALANLQTEIETPYKAKGTVTSENGGGQLTVDHFESATFYIFTPAAGDPVDFSTDLDAAKQYFSEHTDAVGTFTRILDVHEYRKWDYTYDLIVQKPSAVDEVITTVDIGNVWKNLDSSQPVAFTAEVNPNSDCVNQMTLTDEYWQQVAIDGSRIAKSNPQKPIAGETYSYAVKLTAKDGYYFHDGFKYGGVGCDVICDGSTTTAFAGTLSNDRKELTLWFNDIKVTATDGSSQDIDVIEINNATITFKDGDKPVFTGNVPDNEDYAFRCEWWSLDSDTGLVSTEPEWGSEIYKNKITTFEAGKTYHYGVYVTAYYGNFSPDAKLKINGQYVNYKRVGDDDDMQSMWLETDLTMTPTTSSHTHSYGTDWKSDADNHWHECSCGIIADKAAHDMETKNAKDATATEKGYTGDKVCKVCGYTVKGEAIPAVGTTKPDGNKDVTSPQTGDNSNMVIWLAVLFVSFGGVVGCTVYGRRRKLNKW